MKSKNKGSSKGKAATLDRQLELGKIEVKKVIKQALTLVEEVSDFLINNNLPVDESIFGHLQRCVDLAREVQKPGSNLTSEKILSGYVANFDALGEAIQPNPVPTHFDAC